MSKPQAPGMDRLPPHSLEAEQGVLGCILLSPDECWDECAQKLKGGSMAFYDLRNRAIYEAMSALADKRQPIDIITLQNALVADCGLEKVGGLAYLAGLPDLVPSASNLGYYIEILRDKFLLRDLVRRCAETTAAVYAGEEDKALELLRRMDGEWRGFEDAAIDPLETKLSDILVECVNDVEHYRRGLGELLGLRSGFAYWDKMLGGLGPGLHVVAGRPGSGKTSYAMNIAEELSIKKVPVGVFSLEMKAKSLGMRLWFGNAGADYQKYRTGRFQQTRDLPKLVTASTRLAGATLWVDDTPDQTMTQIRAKARRWVRQYGIKLIMVDYFQLIRGEGRQAFKRQEELERISAQFVALWKELEIPLLVLAQMNREHEKDPNRKPRLSDLRDCGAIEQDAESVTFIYPPKENDKELEVAEKRKGEGWSDTYRVMHALVAKNRNGPTGDCALLFAKANTRFEDLYEAREEEAQAPTQNDLTMPTDEDLGR